MLRVHHGVASVSSRPAVAHDYSSFLLMLAMYSAAFAISKFNGCCRAFPTGRQMDQEIAMISQPSKTSAPAGVPAPTELLTAKEYAKAAKVGRFDLSPTIAKGSPVS